MVLIKNLPADIILQAFYSISITDSSSHLVQSFLVSHCATFLLTYLLVVTILDELYLSQYTGKLSLW